MLTGPKESMAEAWKLIRRDYDSSATAEVAALPRADKKGIELDPVEDSNTQRFLGCIHHFSEKTSPITGKLVRACEFDMEQFLGACVTRYKELAQREYDRQGQKHKVKMKPVATPSLTSTKTQWQSMNIFRPERMSSTEHRSEQRTCLTKSCLRKPTQRKTIFELTLPSMTRTTATKKATRSQTQMMDIYSHRRQKS
jgi:hypothetical protein